MIYVADDPELGYFDEQDVRHTRHGLVAVDSDGEWIAYVQEATCSQCEGKLPPDAEYALCNRCNGTARAHARLEQDRREWEADGAPD